METINTIIKEENELVVHSGYGYSSYEFVPKTEGGSSDDTYMKTVVKEESIKREMDAGATATASTPGSEDTTLKRRKLAEEAAKTLQDCFVSICRLPYLSISCPFIVGSSIAGPSTSGSLISGPSTSGSSISGPSIAGPSSSGSSIAGPSTSGSSIAGPSTSGTSISGSSIAGPSTSGSSIAGPSTSGSSIAGPSTSGSSISGSSIAGPSTSGFSISGPSTSSTSISDTSILGPSLSESKNLMDGATNDPTNKDAAQPEIKSERKKTFCPVCQLPFTGGIARHMRNKHPNDYEAFGGRNWRQVKAETNRRGSQNKLRKKKQCQICKNFVINITRHMRSIHEDHEAPEQKGKNPEVPDQDDTEKAERLMTIDEARKTTPVNTEEFNEYIDSYIKTELQKKVLEFEEQARNEEEMSTMFKKLTVYRFIRKTTKRIDSSNSEPAPVQASESAREQPSEPAREQPSEPTSNAVSHPTSNEISQPASYNVKRHGRRAGFTEEDNAILRRIFTRRQHVLSKEMRRILLENEDMRILQDGARERLGQEFTVKQLIDKVRVLKDN